MVVAMRLYLRFTRLSWSVNQICSWPALRTRSLTPFSLRLDVKLEWPQTGSCILGRAVGDDRLQIDRLLFQDRWRNDLRRAGNAGVISDAPINRDSTLRNDCSTYAGPRHGQPDLTVSNSGTRDAR